DDVREDQRLHDPIHHGRSPEPSPPDPHDGNGRLIPDHPDVVPRGDVEDITGDDTELRPIVQPEPQFAPERDSYMAKLTAFAPDERLDLFTPVPAWLTHDSADDELAEPHRLGTSVGKYLDFIGSVQRLDRLAHRAVWICHGSPFDRDRRMPVPERGASDELALLTGHPRSGTDLAAHPIRQTGLADVGAGTRKQGFVGQSGSEVAGLGVGHYPPGILASHQGFRDQLIETEPFRSSHFPDTEDRRADGHPCDCGCHIVGRHRLNQDWSQSDDVAISASVSDATNELEELGGMDDRIRNRRLLDQLLLDELGSEIPTLG